MGKDLEATKTKPLELDGRTGEGGGQLVRVAVALSAATSQPVKITHVRGNRTGGRAGGKVGGLKAQHVSSIAYLAKATGAEVKGLEVGAQTVEFHPRLPPTALTERHIKIVASTSAASTMLIFQAMLPFLLFASNEQNEPVEVEISGGTNVAWSPSYEYLDQVLLPALDEWFGIKVERKLLSRGWVAGPHRAGTVWFKIHPVQRGEKLRLRLPDRSLGPEDFKVKRIDANIVTPSDMHGDIQRGLVSVLQDRFPDVDVNFSLVEDSGHDGRVYVLLVAHSETLRWGHDALVSVSLKKKPNKVKLAKNISESVSKGLWKEVARRGIVDEHLQDQLVVFQALADGKSLFTRPDEDDAAQEELAGAGLVAAMGRLALDADQLKQVKRTEEAFGQGTQHCRTARWVTTELLPQVVWYNSGTVCNGIGLSFEDNPS